MLLLKDSSGREFRLSSGKHNRLQVAVVTQFAPRFAPGAKLLYLGGPANTPLIMESKELARLRFSVVKYSQLSDLVLYGSKKRWIAEAPDHLIHYNGDKFIGPRQSPPPRRKAK